MRGRASANSVSAENTYDHDRQERCMSGRFATPADKLPTLGAWKAISASATLRQTQVPPISLKPRWKQAARVSRKAYRAVAQPFTAAIGRCD